MMFRPYHHNYSFAIINYIHTSTKMTGIKNIYAILAFMIMSLFNLQKAFSQNNFSDSTKRPLRAYHAKRISSSERPVIDGKLNDDCWKVGEWAGNYTQWIPNEGAKPSQPTQLKILYDDKN